MRSFAETLLAQATAWTWLEFAAVVAAVLYLLLAIRQNILCWVFALLSTAIYVLLFVDARLYMEAVLNVFYFAMAVYGWLSWRHGGDLVVTAGFAAALAWVLGLKGTESPKQVAKTVEIDISRP